MAYTALPDRRMPYDNDGTVIYEISDVTTDFSTGPGSVLSGGAMATLNAATFAVNFSGGDGTNVHFRVFFPEQREVTAIAAVYRFNGSGGAVTATIQGSNDTTNGMDGTWETGVWSSGSPANITATSQGVPPDAWRTGIYPVSFTGPKKVIGVRFGGSGGSTSLSFYMLHIYGQKAAGRTPDDILFLNGLTSYAEFAAPEDFGDVPLATTSTRTFKVKNASATHTANTINIQCNDADFAISTDNVTWVVTINIASLAAGASSGVMYVRNTAPGIGSALGPRFARIVATVASYT